MAVAWADGLVLEAPALCKQAEGRGVELRAIGQHYHVRDAVSGELRFE